MQAPCADYSCTAQPFKMSATLLLLVAGSPFGTAASLASAPSLATLVLQHSAEPLLFLSALSLDYAAAQMQQMHQVCPKQ
jgi:hypothetical protein